MLLGDLKGLAILERTIEKEFEILKVSMIQKKFGLWKVMDLKESY